MSYSSSSSSLRVSSLTIPSLGSLSSSSSCSLSSISTSRSGSQLWDSCPSESDLTDITAPGTPTNDDTTKSVIEASLLTLAALKEEHRRAFPSPQNTPIVPVDQGDAGYEAEAEEYHDLPRTSRRVKFGALPTRPRRHRRRTPVSSPCSPPAGLGFYTAAGDASPTTPTNARKPGCLRPAHVALSPITPYVWERKDRKAYVGLGLGLPSTHPLQSIPETEVLASPGLELDSASAPKELSTNHLPPRASSRPSAPPLAGLGIYPLQTIYETQVLETPKSTLSSSPVELGPSPQLRPHLPTDSPSPILALPPLLLPFDAPQPQATADSSASLPSTLLPSTMTRLRLRKPAARWAPRREIPRITKLSDRGRPLMSPILEEDEA
ncbi:hypothetical protein OE88DRAFT_1642769 [Heliocybe sulcata]|uniref:Uncharacterized protein n=1 Tax=Heliocybe sulcata TaxID=5364 RepID=A0A5C3NA06_9AGAM|nr:hypothetical protein OE88DRAFT_1642769 [Heliocybe sulcata]